MKPKRIAVPTENRKKNIVFSLAAIAIVSVFAYLIVSILLSPATSTKSVLVAKKDITVGEPLNDSNVTVEKVATRDYKNFMILEKDKKLIEGKYASFYIPKGVALHKDALEGEKRVKNAFLSSLPADQETITLPFDYMQAGGEILKPGDKVRIRAIYTIGDRDNQQTVSERVCDATVIDLLSKDGKSIYELYKDLIMMPEETRNEKLKDEGFTRKLVPAALIFTLPTSEVDKFASIMQKSGASGQVKYMYTILTRSGNQSILENQDLFDKIDNMMINSSTVYTNNNNNGNQNSQSK